MTGHFSCPKFFQTSKLDQSNRVAKIDVSYAIRPFERTPGTKIDWKSLEVEKNFGQKSCQVIWGQLCLKARTRFWTSPVWKPKQCPGRSRSTLSDPLKMGVYNLRKLDLRTKTNFWDFSLRARFGLPCLLHLITSKTERNADAFHEIKQASENFDLSKCIC